MTERDIITTVIKRRPRRIVGRPLMAIARWLRRLASSPTPSPGVDFTSIAAWEASVTSEGIHRGVVKDIDYPPIEEA